MVSDFFASLTKIQFEVRKQLIQMYTRESTIGQLAKAAQSSWLPLMLRDTGFRTILLTMYYTTTDVQHKPIQKYSMPQIVDFMKERRAYNRARGEPYETHQQLSYLFFEFHNYEVKSLMTTRMSLLLIGNFIATLFTNPFDVCLSKLAT